MVVTRTPLCSVKVCPAPRDPDAHVCPHCGGIEVHHQHVDPKRMGGSPSRDVPENIVMICPWLHEEITLHRLSDAIIDIFGERLYRVWDIHNNTVCEYKPYWIQGVGDGWRGIDSPVLDADGDSNGHLPTPVTTPDDFLDDLDNRSFNSSSLGALTGGVSGSPLSAEASNLIAPDTVPSRETAVGGDYSTAVETSPNRVTTVTGPGGVAGTLRPFLDMDFEEWRSWGPRLAHNLNASRWLLGEWLLDGETKWGQMYAQAEAETGLDYSTLTSYRSVVKAYREAELLPQATTSFSVLSVLAPVVRRDAEEGERLLLRAEAQSMTGDEVRREVRLLTGEVEHETRLCDMGYSHRV